MFSVTADGDNQPSLLLTTLDWNEHAAGATATGIVTTYQASLGQYDSSTYGWIGLKAHNSFAAAGDVTNSPLLGASDRDQARSHAAPEPTLGTPGSVTAVAASVLGQAPPSSGTRLPDDRLLPDWLGRNAILDPVGGMTVATAQTSGLMVQATDSSASLGTPGPEDWSGSQQGSTALNVTVATTSVVRTTASLTQVLYLQETGDPALISVNDIHQGQIGDCFLLSSIGELAL